jgi:hypothetical protein
MSLSNIFKRGVHMHEASDVRSFLGRVRSALLDGNYEFTKKSRKEILNIKITEERAIDILIGLEPDDWERDEAAWDKSGKIIRVFMPFVEELSEELWIRLCEENGGFLLIISFHPSGAS